MTNTQRLIATSNYIGETTELTAAYPNRKKVCVACSALYFVSLKKNLAKSRYCSRQCSDTNMPKGYWNKGKPLSPEHRKWLIENAKRGEESHFWKGGVTEKNQIIRTSGEYALWREAVFARDKWTCAECGARSEKGKMVYLNADHIKPFAYFPEFRFDVSNGRTLCHPCHKKTETYGTKIRNIYKDKAPKYGKRK